MTAALFPWPSANALKPYACQGGFTKTGWCTNQDELAVVNFVIKDFDKPRTLEHVFRQSRPVQLGVKKDVFFQIHHLDKKE